MLTRHSAILRSEGSTTCKAKRVSETTKPGKDSQALARAKEVSMVEISRI